MKEKVIKRKCIACHGTGWETIPGSGPQKMCEHCNNGVAIKKIKIFKGHVVLPEGYMSFEGTNKEKVQRAMDLLIEDLKKGDDDVEDQKC